MSRTPTLLRPAITGEAQPDWTARAGRGRFAYLAVAGPSGDGAIVELPPGHRGPLAPRAGQVGWRWLGAAWPDAFVARPATPSPPAGRCVEEWYLGAPLQRRPRPPSPPSVGERVWRITLGDGALAGLLIRGPGLLRWELRAEHLVDGALPDEPLAFEPHPWPLPTDGSWAGAVGRRVP